MNIEAARQEWNERRNQRAISSRASTRRVKVKSKPAKAPKPVEPPKVVEVVEVVADNHDPKPIVQPVAKVPKALRGGTHSSVTVGPAVRAAVRSLTALTTFIALTVTVTEGLPALGHGLRLPVLAGSLFIALVAGVSCLRQLAHHQVRYGHLLMGLIAMAVLGLVSLGANSTVLGGAPYLASSRTAKVYATAEQLRADTLHLATYDDMINSSDAVAVAHRAQITQAIADCTAKTTKYEAMLEDAPSTNLQPSVNELAQASVLCVQGLDLRLQVLDNYDSTRAQSMQAVSAQYESALSPIIPDLTQMLSDDYGISLDPKARQDIAR